MDEEADRYKTLWIGNGEITPDRPAFVLPPVIEENLSNFHPLGWYGVIKTNRKWWQFWKPKTKGVWGMFKDEEDA